jgi:hypothetical protein
VSSNLASLTGIEAAESAGKQLQVDAVSIVPYLFLCLIKEVLVFDLVQVSWLATSSSPRFFGQQVLWSVEFLVYIRVKSLFFRAVVVPHTSLHPSN